MLDVAYVGKTSVNQLRTRNISQLLAGTIQANPWLQRPRHGLAALDYTTLDGRCSYNSLQISPDRRFSSGPGFGVAYTFRSLDDFPRFQAPQPGPVSPLPAFSVS